jgi:peptide/nickel transport system permease protein
VDATPTSGGFHDVDWESLDGGPERPGVGTLALVGVTILLTLAFAWTWAGFPFDDAVPGLETLDGLLRPFSRLDWAMTFAGTVACYLGVTLVDRRRLGEYATRLRRRPVGLLSVVGVGTFLLVGAVAPLVVGEPVVRPAASYQPPVGFSVDAAKVYSCVGPVVEGRCRGSLQYPLGTTFELAVVTTAIIVPVAVTVGTAAAYLGGLADELLMGLTDAVGTIPPFVAYVVVRFVLGEGGDMLLLVAIFGLLGWAGVARAVRSAVLQRRESLYVAASEAAGGSRRWIARRHVLPNVGATIVATTANRVATLVLTEAALSYLGLGAPQVTSWGTLVADGISGQTLTRLLGIWWVSVVPALALALTVVYISLFGDTVEELVDPRRGT